MNIFCSRLMYSTTEYGYLHELYYKFDPIEKRPREMIIIIITSRQGHGAEPPTTTTVRTFAEVLKSLQHHLVAHMTYYIVQFLPTWHSTCVHGVCDETYTNRGGSAERVRVR